MTSADPPTMSRMLLAEAGVVVTSAGLTTAPQVETMPVAFLDRVVRLRNSLGSATDRVGIGL